MVDDLGRGLSRLERRPPTVVVAIPETEFGTAHKRVPRSCVDDMANP